MAPRKNTKSCDTQGCSGIKKTRSRKLFSYSEKNLQLALQAIRENNVGVRAAAKEYGVPKSTVQDRISGKRLDVLRKTGPQPIMTVEGEKRIANWVLNLAKCGFPIKKAELMETVTKIAIENGKIDQFLNKKPGERWYKNFLKRNPEISVREAESINKARATITEEFIRSWFRELQNFLKENHIEDVMTDPSRIYNGDESGFSLCPKTGKVLAPRGYKNVYSIKLGNEKETITVLVTFNANGNICPPLVIFPYVRPPKVLIQNMPENWVLGKSDSGWMRSEVFYEYIANDFNQWLNINDIKRPIILFIDGHKSHINMHLSEFCEKSQIILYALPANTTHILQPADVSVFRPLKHQWKVTIRNWQSRQENPNSSVTKINFCQIFEDALNNTDMAPCIVNGFRKCGLFPLDPDSVDFTKCVKNVLEKNVAKQPDIEITAEEIETTMKVIKGIEDKLVNRGCNVEIIYTELSNFKDLKTTTKKIHIIQDVKLNDLTRFSENGDQDGEDLNFVPDINTESRKELDLVTVGSVVPMESVEIIEFDEVLEYTVFNNPDLRYDVTESTDPTEDKSSLQGSDETIGQLDTKALTEKNSPNNSEYITQEEPLKIKLTEIIQDNNLKTSDQIIAQVASKETTIDKNLNISNTQQLDPKDSIEEKSLNISQDLEEKRPEIKQTEYAEKTIADMENYSPNKEKTLEGDKNQGEKIEKLPLKERCNLETAKPEDNTLKNVYQEKTPNKPIDLPVEVSPFSRHLQFPEPINKSEKKKAPKLPSAISSRAWRHYYEKKEREKELKLDEQKKKKEERLNKQKAKKDSINQKNEGNKKRKLTKRNKVKCGLCEDELISDTEDDMLKNIGCDNCSNWYHLACTSLSHLDYEEAAMQDFICSSCS